MRVHPRQMPLHRIFHPHTDGKWQNIPVKVKAIEQNLYAANVHD